LILLKLIYLELGQLSHAAIHIVVPANPAETLAIETIYCLREAVPDFDVTIRLSCRPITSSLDDEQTFSGEIPIYA
jgi:hypothetical protein